MIKTTHQLAEGDIVRLHGMILRLENRRTWDYAPGVVRFDGVITNIAEVSDPFILRFASETNPPTWAVQGNDLATWWVMEAPEVGVPTRLVGVQHIVPTYVRPSAKPLPNGACELPDEDHPQRGWYVEYRYVGETTQHRDFLPFEKHLGPEVTA